MIYLFGSIILTTYLILAFKLLERLRLNTFQAIVFNYVTCVVTGSVVNGSFPVNPDNVTSDWFSWACVMGVIFIVTFNILGITAQRINVAVASVAYRLPLIIPVVFSIYLYNEKVFATQWIGLLLALVAVVLTSLPNRQTEAKNVQTHVLLFALPLILFFGSGVLDTLIKYTEQRFLNETNKNAFLSTAFASAAIIGLFTLFIKVIKGIERLDWKNILAGVLIGVPNYFSIWCLVKFLQMNLIPSSAAIPLNNMGIVSLGAIAAWLLFQERLSKMNWIGIFLSIVAIALIAFGDKI